MATLHTYTKVNFKDKPNQTTPINKTNLDHVEDGIVNAYTDIAALNTEKAANVPSFSEAASRVNISSGENMPTMLGKIKKFFADLKTVAFSGSYNDLSGKPSLAAVATSGSYNDLSNKPSYATVATSGSYDDLINEPVGTEVTLNMLSPGYTDCFKTVTVPSGKKVIATFKSISNVTKPIYLRTYALNATSWYISAAPIISGDVPFSSSTVITVNYICI